jgi:hypothetical protein
MSKIKPELISIFKIQVFRSVIDALPEYTDNPVKPANFRVGFSQNSAFNVEMQSVRIRLEILLDGIDQDDKLVGVTGNFGIEFHIHVANFEEFILDPDGIKKISNLLLGTLLSIAYSTARGIVFERTQGTWLNGVILPVIDPKELESGGSAQ